MEESGFSFTFLRKLENRCKKVNEWKASASIKWPDCLRYKNATIKPKNIDDKGFQYGFAFTQHYNVITNNSEWKSNIKPFVGPYRSVKYLVTIDTNNYTSFEKKPPEIALIVFYLDVKVELVKVVKEHYANIHKPIKQSYVSNHYHERGESNFLINSWWYINPRIIQRN